jgi:hypothetical protein
MAAEKSLDERLQNGARVLGDLWRSGERCARGWSVWCECSPRGKFCRAKLLWIELATGAGREIDDESEYAVIEAMKASEFDATGLVAVVEHPASGRLRVGPGGGIRSMRDLALVASKVDEAGRGTIARVLSTFPGSTVITEDADHAH